MDLEKKKKIGTRVPYKILKFMELKFHLNFFKELEFHEFEFQEFFYFLFFNSL